MEEKGSLGLFLARDKAVAVWLSATDAAVTAVRTINPDPEKPVTLALQAARSIANDGQNVDESFVAVDCGYYTQYKLHSEFDDYHQIESTIKYDVEEAAAADAMNMAVTFDITGKAEVGSDVTAYTADRQALTDILLDVQEGAIDPTFIEPDVACLARALNQGTPLSDRAETLFIILAATSCYVIRSQGDFAPAGRTFLIGSAQDVTGLLAREIMLARGAVADETPITSISLMGQIERVNAEQLAARTGLDVQIQTPDPVLADVLEQNPDVACHELMIAYGAALAIRTRGHNPDFRRDFMPYQGRRRIVQSSLRLIGISLTVLLVAVAVFYQLKAFRINRDIAKLNARMLTDYKAANFGKKPIRGMPVPSSLKTELSRAKQAEAGIGPGGEKSVPAKLTYFFDAVNKTSPKVNIRIQQITITERSMKVKGNTNNRSGTMALFNQIKKHPRINLSSERVAAGPDNRDIFDITLEPKTSEKRR